MTRKNSAHPHHARSTSHKNQRPTRCARSRPPAGDLLSVGASSIAWRGPRTTCEPPWSSQLVRTLTHPRSEQRPSVWEADRGPNIAGQSRVSETQISPERSTGLVGHAGVLRGFRDEQGSMGTGTEGEPDGCRRFQGKNMGVSSGRCRVRGRPITSAFYNYDAVGVFVKGTGAVVGPEHPSTGSSRPGSRPAVCLVSSRNSGARGPLV